MVLGQRELALRRGGIGAVDGRQCLGDQPLGGGLDVPVAVDAVGQGPRAGAVDQAAGVALGQADDAPQLALPDAAFDGEQQLAQPRRVGPDGLGLGQDVARLARGVEHALVVGQHHRARALGAGVGAQQGLCLQVADLDAALEHAHQHPAADGRRACGVAAVVDAHAAVVADGALGLGEVLHPQQGQGLQVGLLFLEHGLHLAAFAAVDARGRPLGLPVLQEGVLLFDRLEAPALQRRGLGVADGVLHGALAVGVAHARRVGHHAVVRQGRGIDRVEFGLVQVGLEHALLEVVEHDVVAAAAEVAPGLLVQPRPDLLAGAPDHAAVAAPRVAQRGHEQPRLAPAVGAGHARERPLAVVDLHLLAGQEGQAVELLGLAVAQLVGEALDRVVGAGVAVQIHQVLVDGHGVAAQAKLGLDEGAVGLAGRRRGRCHRCQRPVPVPMPVAGVGEFAAPGRRPPPGSRWPPRGNLPQRRRRTASGNRGSSCDRSP